VLDHLPERDRAKVRHQLRAAWAHDDHGRALDGLRRLARELDHHHPGAASSLREGLKETVTLTRLKITGNLRTTLQSTNAIESMISILRRTSRNVKRWQSGDMCLALDGRRNARTEQQFRKIIGYPDLAKLALAVERDLTASRSSTTCPRPPSRPLRSSPPDHQPRIVTAKFHSAQDIVPDSPLDAAGELVRAHNLSIFENLASDHRTASTLVEEDWHALLSPFHARRSRQALASTDSLDHDPATTRA
jgi:hypothetical protein